MWSPVQIAAECVIRDFKELHQLIQRSIESANRAQSLALLNQMKGMSKAMKYLDVVEHRDLETRITHLEQMIG